jgi:hypothetical protein
MATDDISVNERLYRQGLVPLIVGVTGHRDLVPEELPQIRKLVTSFFGQLRERFPDRPLQLLSPLAEGADQLVAEVALQLGVGLAVPMPMRKDLYITDFETPSALDEFEQLCERADAIYELPVVQGGTLESLAAYGEERDRQYAQLGVFLCAHCHILLALWDGKPSREIGGTAQVVQFHHDDTMAGYVASESIDKQLLANDESDLVYHIVVSRQRPNGEPAQELVPLTCSWFTTDPDEPRTAEMPDEYVDIFERTSQFNREARRHFRQIERGCYPLFDDESTDLGVPPAARRINRLFCAADWLAIHCQRRMLSALRITHGLAFLMGMMFILYSDFEARQPFMLVFFACFAIAFAVHQTAARLEWHSKYLEYRTLAEGLRVQFYWAVAGVTSDMVSKYSHDNFLQKQDVDLGWIRNVMRVGGIGCDVAPNRDPRGLEFSIREWIGDERGGGQLKYYASKTAHHKERSRQLDVLGQIVGISVTVMLIAVVAVSSDDVRDRLFIALGAVLLALGVRQAYAYGVAERELIKQYEFMYSIFRNAKRRLEAAPGDFERRRILRVLGESALDEHAEWIFVRRERSPDPAALWRMES